DDRGVDRADGDGVGRSCEPDFHRQNDRREVAVCLLPCRVIALNLHRTAAGAIAIAFLAGACASASRPAAAPAAPASSMPTPQPTSALSPSGRPAPQAMTSQPKPSTSP